jgi:choline dehydrogenase-like flavoprotein
MGRRPQSLVTNSYGQSHDIANLSLAGPNLFPICGGVNPTFTTHALTLRSSEYMIKNWTG